MNPAARPGGWRRWPWATFTLAAGVAAWIACGFGVFLAWLANSGIDDGPARLDSPAVSAVLAAFLVILMAWLAGVGCLLVARALRIQHAQRRLGAALLTLLLAMVVLPFVLR